MSRRSKYDGVYDILKREIASLSVGAKIPSVRQLMERFNLSQAPVSRALRQLQQEGEIASVTGSGTFKLDPSTDSKHRPSLNIAMAVPDFPSAFFVQVYNAFNEYFSSKGHFLQVIHYHWAKRFDRIAALNNIDGLIFIPQGDNASCDELLQFLNQANKPLVVVDRFPVNPHISAVATDNAAGGRLAAEHLLEQGHRKLAVLLAEPHNPNNMARLEGFRKQAEAAQAELTVIDSNTSPGASPAACAYKKMTQVFNDDLLFTGLFTDDHSGALGALKACRESDISVPGQLSVIAFGNMSESDYIFPALTAIEQQFGLWAREALKSIDRSLQAPQNEVLRTLISPRLVARESTAANHFD